MYNILLIENDKEVSRIVGNVLPASDFTLWWAENGLTGIRMARSASFDAVLLDLNLPDLAGNVVALTLRGIAALSSAPIIALTAEPSAQARRLARAFGCDDYLTRPIDVDTFADQVAEIIRRKRESAHA